MSRRAAGGSGAAGHPRVVPEVTFCAGRLERAPARGDAVAMHKGIAAALSPLNFAAYLAWAAIGWELVFASVPAGTGLVAAPAPAMLAAMHLAFIALFIAVTTAPDGVKPLQRLLLLGQLALAFVLMALVRNHSLPVLLILVAVQVVHLWSPRAALAIIVGTNVLVYLVYARLWGVQSPLVSTLMYMSFQGFAALTAWFAHRAEAARDALAVSHADLLATRSLLAETARDSERLRLSRELHDVAGHKLTALKLNLGAMARDPRHAGDDTVGTCARLADELLADIRGVVQQMRADEGLELGSALEALAGSFPRPSLQLQINPSARATSLAQAEAVLRVVQEGLTNAARHSQAQTLWVVLQREHGGLRLDIRDDGRGRGELQPGNGLRGMRERLQAVGGELRIGRTDTGGVHLQAWLPVAA